MYALLDKFFFVFHSAFVVFNLFGWMWPKTRRANLVALSLTALSWFGLGLWYGIGYCPCTDWHWQIRQHLGYGDMPASYIKFLLDAWTGSDWHPAVVDALTLTGFTGALVASGYTNVRDFRRRKTRDIAR